MIAFIKNLKMQMVPKGSFVENVMILMTGTTIAQVISIAISPILTRIYTPNEFGAFALFMSIVSIISVMQTGKYELAVMLPEKDEGAVNVIALCILVSSIVSSVTLLAIWIFNKPITKSLDNSEISILLYLIPLIVLMTGIYSAIYYWSNRKKQYKRLAISKIFQSISNAGMNIGMGVAGFGVSGLILSVVGSQTVATGVLGWQSWKKDKDKIKLVTKEKITLEAKKYSDFPRYSITSDFINVTSNQLPIFMLSIFFNDTIIGLYSLTQRVLATPIGFIAASILDVFKQKASNDYIINGNCKDIYVKTFKSLAFFSIIPFILFFITAPDIFALVFGIKWRTAGEYAQILSVMYAFKFISSPLSYMYYIAEKQKEDFLLHLYIGVSTLLTLIIGQYIFGTIKASLILFSANYSIVYLVYIFRSYQFSKGI